jgi:hypothetical protein
MRSKRRGVRSSTSPRDITRLGCRRGRPTVTKALFLRTGSRLGRKIGPPQLNPGLTAVLVLARTKESTMTRLLCAAAIAVAGLGLDQRPVAASEAPWCAVLSFGWAGVIWDCQYRSVEECAPTVVAGNRGSCSPNPRYVATQRPERTRSARHHPRRHRSRQL